MAFRQKALAKAIAKAIRVPIIFAVATASEPKIKRFPAVFDRLQNEKRTLVPRKLRCASPATASMTTYKTRDFAAALLRKGFRIDETDHHQYWFYLDGKKTLIRTKTSHGEKEFDDFLFGKRREQMHLSKRQLLDFIDCHFTAEEYRQILLDNGIVR